jgi:hypothetical protein
MILRKSFDQYSKRIDYSFLFFEYIAKPIVPQDNPATEAPQEKKFKKNVDSNTWMTIRKGKIIPKSMRVRPRIRRKPGEFSIFIYLFIAGILLFT